MQGQLEDHHHKSCLIMSSFINCCFGCFVHRIRSIVLRNPTYDILAPFYLGVLLNLYRLEGEWTFIFLIRLKTKKELKYLIFHVFKSLFIFYN